jgi:hypothetical protein
MVQLLSDSSKALAHTYQHPRETINLNTHYHENLKSQAKTMFGSYNSQTSTEYTRNKKNKSGMKFVSHS